MNEITVTMPMSQYEENKRVMEKLKKESIKRFIKMEYTSAERNGYTVQLDAEKVNDYLDNKYPERQKITTFKS